MWMLAIKHTTHTRNQNKQSRVRRRNHKNKGKKTKYMWKSLILLKDKEKRFGWVILSQNWP
jgi:hypothetical protein